MLIDCLLLAALGAARPPLMPGGAAPVARVDGASSAATEKGAVPLFASDRPRKGVRPLFLEQGAAQPPKPGKAPKKKKTKKVPKENQPAPDEPVDVNVPDPGRGVRFTWKQHPSLRVGSVLRVDPGITGASTNPMDTAN